MPMLILQATATKKSQGNSPDCKHEQEDAHNDEWDAPIRSHIRAEKKRGCDDEAVSYQHADPVGTNEKLTRKRGVLASKQQHRLPDLGRAVCKLLGSDAVWAERVIHGAHDAELVYH